MNPDALSSILDRSQAVIFDLDGVIADTEPLKFAAYQTVFREVYGVELPTEDMTWKGMSEQSVITYWFEKLQLTGEPEKLILAKRAAYYSFLELGKITAVAGVIDFVHWLCSVEKLRGVATSSSYQEAIMVLGSLGLSTAFNGIVTRNDVKQLKPHPEVYLRIASRLGIQPSSCLVFEDSQSGVSAAKAAGMSCVGLTTSFSKKAMDQADQIITDFTNLLIYT